MLLYFRVTGALPLSVSIAGESHVTTKPRLRLDLANMLQRLSCQLLFSDFWSAA